MKKILFIAFFSISIVGCKPKNISQSKLQPEKVVSLKIPEPSGISIFNNNLFIVSDHNNTIYKTDLEGEILSKIKVKISDLEGITLINNNELFVVNELKRKVYRVNLNGEVVEDFKIKGKQKVENSGLEGICFVESENCFFIVNEKQPTQLLKVTREGEILETFHIEFANDLSGICFDEVSSNFWLVSDESQAIFKINKEGKLLKKYSIPVKKAEGIAITNTEIFVVSDSEELLYIFKKPE